jgi:activator of HSP90 ATPase
MATIKQTAVIKGATADDLYETIMDAKKHTSLSGAPTTMSRRVGGRFAVGHDLEGKNLKLVPGKRIVQSWRANNWPKGTYSKATFAFARSAGGAKITFTQTGVPDKFRREISTGWKSYYWGPMRKKFAKAR